VNECPKIVPKGWGHELWIHNDERYCGKLLYFHAGKRCSLHYHKLKHETFYLQSGRISFTTYMLGDEDLSMTEILIPGDVRELVPGLVHQMLALDDSELFEFSTQHFDDDSYRIVKGD
jgi:quercetin dioxygenase-like cupin family protein